MIALYEAYTAVQGISVHFRTGWYTPYRTCTVGYLTAPLMYCVRCTICPLHRLDGRQSDIERSLFRRFSLQA